MKNKPVSVAKRLLFTSKLAFYSFLEVFQATKWSNNFILLSFLALALASGATRPRLGVSEHPPNPQFQGLKIDLCGYRCPNYFSRSAPDVLQKSHARKLSIKITVFFICAWGKNRLTLGSKIQEDNFSYSCSLVFPSIKSFLKLVSHVLDIR